MVRYIKFKNFLNFIFAMNKKVAEITYFNINTGLKFPKLGTKLAGKTRFCAIFKNFLKDRRFIVKNF